MTVPQKLEKLRAIMAKKNIDAWIIPGTDPHQSEYLPEYWNERQWISGFTGSAGQVVVTQTTAGLWTDSRYFLQAEEELANSTITLHKLNIAGEMTVQQFLAAHLSSGNVLGINPLLFSVDAVNQLKEAFASTGIQLNTDEDLIHEIWTDRPPISDAPILVLEERFAGLNVQTKLDKLRAHFEGESWSFLVTSLDEIAWLFNIRGSDIAYNPLIVSWAIITKNKATLYVDQAKLSANVKASLTENKVEIADYQSVFQDLQTLNGGHSVYIDLSKVNQHIFQSIPSSCQIFYINSPITLLKSVKNSVEVEGIKNAMQKDGVALVRFLMKLETILSAGETISEYDVGLELKHLRSQQKDFFGESFNTIAGYNANGAIVHYAPPSKGSSILKAKGTLLFDSGAHYFDGTTDITRTIALGEFSKEFATDYTLVLKGVIGLSRAVFPKGTTGIQLDILARSAMWQRGIDFGHGTGHGVGHFLNVHEGPQAIRKEGNMVAFQEGMTITIEPGIYKAGLYGIRTENMVTTVAATDSEFGSFLKFETLTLCPIDTRMINMDLLTRDEIVWLNNYHQTVYSKLSPFLSDTECEWLQQKTQPLNEK